MLELARDAIESNTTLDIPGDELQIARARQRRDDSAGSDLRPGTQRYEEED
jgi:hypothetical protein